MKKTFVIAKDVSLRKLAILLVLSVSISEGCKKDEVPAKLLKDFTQVNLVSSSSEYNPMRMDTNLVNAWGLAFNTTGIAWMSAEAAGLSVVYDKEGNQVRPPVAIPTVNAPMGGHPTGIVFNGTGDFKLANGNPARFLFVGDDGIISGWNTGNSAVQIMDKSATSAYTGLTMATSNGANFLYAANFRAGAIDVFNKDLVQVMDKPFKDPAIPSGYAPFNIQSVGDHLYVLYAKVGEDGEEEVGPGKGFVDIYTTNGILVKRLASRGQLNAPWGIAQAPAAFFQTADSSSHGNNHDNNELQSAILVGNFGDGRINVYNSSGIFLGQLRAHGRPVEIDGLWALSFPPATATTIDPLRLYFTAGPDDEKEGLFGYIKREDE